MSFFSVFTERINRQIYSHLVDDVKKTFSRIFMKRPQSYQSLIVMYSLGNPRYFNSGNLPCSSLFLEITNQLAVSRNKDIIIKRQQPAVFGTDTFINDFCFASRYKMFKQLWLLRWKPLVYPTVHDFLTLGMRATYIYVFCNLPLEHGSLKYVFSSFVVEQFSIYCTYDSSIKNKLSRDSRINARYTRNSVAK